MASKEAATLAAKAQAMSGRNPFAWDRLENAARAIWATYPEDVPTIDGLIVAALSCIDDPEVLERVTEQLLEFRPVDNPEGVIRS